ncbi:uncharacterized protein LOC121381253 isoform X1 [Gigantopelta aegis]|uniref:uncharacterized protein LOC121381253 isoform X1 n=1 Tax=Gigantopelta aegis TaxID=1735272 RepID=UPI001B887CAC|nr:uncharacterized protein LOC121381253 isoform X1 [Gigantopelta aegis]
MMKRVSCILFLNACLSSWFLFDRNLATADSCTKTGPCTCRNSKGTIDLSALASTSGSPRFQDLAGIGQWLYSWNPCVAFTEGSCSNVAACQTTTGKKKYYNIGTQDSATFNTDSTGKVTLSYSATQEKFTRTTSIGLICDNTQESALVFNGETPPSSGHFFFTLNSKHACIKPDSKGGISTGSILCIVFFSVLFVYMVGGVAFQIFVRKESGEKMVPNYVIWSALPGLIKDGILFTVTCGKTGNYEKI